MFKFIFTLSDDDYFEFSKHALLNSAVWKRRLNLIRILPIIIWLFAIFVFFIRKADLNLIIIESILLAAYSVVIFVLSKPLLLLLLKRRIGRVKKYEKLVSGMEVTLLFENEFFLETTSQSEAKLKYSVIERIDKAEKAVYLYVGAVKAYIIPLNAFADDEIKKQFIIFIKDKINGNNCR